MKDYNDIDKVYDIMNTTQENIGVRHHEHFSNGFVEGTNSRLKMIKRSMYGRCGKQLLEAKLRYMRNGKKRIIAEESELQEYSIIVLEEELNEKKIFVYNFWNGFRSCCGFIYC